MIQKLSIMDLKSIFRQFSDWLYFVELSKNKFLIKENKIYYKFQRFSNIKTDLRFNFSTFCFKNFSPVRKNNLQPKMFSMVVLSKRSFKKSGDSKTKNLQKTTEFIKLNGSVSGRLYEKTKITLQ